MKRTTKHQQVKNHLQTVGSITSLEAIKLFEATRLSAIIFNLRDKGHLIESKDVKTIDKNGNSCTFTRYIYNKKQKSVI